MGYIDEYRYWLENVQDDDLLQELEAMTESSIEDAFYRELSFGTGGLRGVIGAGTNRMNIYTVGKASQGLANYILKHYISEPSIAVSYDSRIKSELFSREASCVFAANGIKVFLYPVLMPTPCLSYAVRSLECSAGIMVTASHNPSKYNGYKVYGADGCQITTEAAEEILAEIEKLNVFEDIKSIDFGAALDKKLVEYIPGSVYDAFTEEVKKQSVLFGDEVDRDVSIVYSPLNGAGLKPVLRALRESGYSNITVVREQEHPDGNFPTCPYPNPEIEEAMALGLEYCKKTGADLLLATDPDCDRCGIAVKTEAGYKLLSGNEVGLIMLDYICSQRIKHGKMPEHPVFVKTIVTMDLAEKIAASYGVDTVNVLTGFKYIGETITKLEAEDRKSSYICGFEESYGYLTGTYVRDKDAVNAAFMICEMFAFYKARGISLTEKLNEIFKKYGYCLNTLKNYEFEGASGMARMNKIMDYFRAGLDAVGGKKTVSCQDYSKGVDGLPKSHVLKYRLEDNCSVVIRPSGTEPKLKAYISVTAEDYATASAIEKRIAAELSCIIN